MSSRNLQVTAFMLQQDRHVTLSFDRILRIKIYSINGLESKPPIQLSTKSEIAIQNPELIFHLVDMYYMSRSEWELLIQRRFKTAD